MKKLILLFKRTLCAVKPMMLRSEQLFYWTGLTQFGELRSGHFFALNLKEAKQKLQEQMIITKTLSQYAKSRRLKAKDITIWLQQLNRLLSIGLSLTQALQTLSTLQTHPKLINLIYQIQKDLNSGMSFSEALSLHPRWFDTMFFSLIRLAENSATMTQILDQIIQQRLKNESLKRQVYTLMLYPLSVMILTSLVTIYLLTTIMPQIQSFFVNAHRPLPWSTQLLLNLSQWIKTYGLISLLVILCLIFYGKIAYQMRVGLQRLVQGYLLNISIIKSFLHAYNLSHSLQAWAIAQQAGLPLIDGLQLIAGITKNYYYRGAFLQIQTAVQQGESIRSALLRARLFPELVVQMISIGEESGTLPLLLNDLSKYYTNTLEHLIQRLSKYIEPILMILVGGMIGGLMLCIYLPMIQLGALL